MRGVRHRAIGLGRAPPAAPRPACSAALRRALLHARTGDGTRPVGPPPRPVRAVLDAVDGLVRPDGSAADRADAIASLRSAAPAAVLDALEPLAARYPPTLPLRQGAPFSLLLWARAGGGGDAVAPPPAAEGDPASWAGAAAERAASLATAMAAAAPRLERDELALVALSLAELPPQGLVPGYRRLVGLALGKLGGIGAPHGALASALVALAQRYLARELDVAEAREVLLQLPRHAEEPIPPAWDSVLWLWSHRARLRSELAARTEQIVGDRLAPLLRALPTPPTSDVLAAAEATSSWLADDSVVPRPRALISLGWLAAVAETRADDLPGPLDLAAAARAASEPSYRTALVRLAAASRGPRTVSLWEHILAAAVRARARGERDVLDEYRLWLALGTFLDRDGRSLAASRIAPPLAALLDQLLTDPDGRLADDPRAVALLGVLRRVVPFTQGLERSRRLARAYAAAGNGVCAEACLDARVSTAAGPPSPLLTDAVRREEPAEPDEDPDDAGRSEGTPEGRRVWLATRFANGRGAPQRFVEQWRTTAQLFPDPAERPDPDPEPEILLALAREVPAESLWAVPQVFVRAPASATSGEIRTTLATRARAALTFSATRLSALATLASVGFTAADVPGLVAVADQLPALVLRQVKTLPLVRRFAGALARAQLSSSSVAERDGSLTALLAARAVELLELPPPSPEETALVRKWAKALASKPVKARGLLTAWAGLGWMRLDPIAASILARTLRGGRVDGASAGLTAASLRDEVKQALASALREAYRRQVVPPAWWAVLAKAAREDPPTFDGLEFEPATWRVVGAARAYFETLWSADRGLHDARYLPPDEASGALDAIADDLEQVELWAFSQVDQPALFALTAAKALARGRPCAVEDRTAGRRGRPAQFVPELMERILGNLISNAVKHGSDAAVAVSTDGFEVSSRPRVPLDDAVAAEMARYLTQYRYGDLERFRPRGGFGVMRRALKFHPFNARPRMSVALTPDDAGAARLTFRLEWFSKGAR